jgi:putative tricarboxylic transport membrane protein
MFAAASIYRLAMNRDSASAGIIKCKKFPGFGMPFKEYWKRKFNILRSAIIGTYIGILPGVGSSTASLISYSTAKNASKDPDSFGTGNIDGVIASETSNNAVIGGAHSPCSHWAFPATTTPRSCSAAWRSMASPPAPCFSRTI